VEGQKGKGGTREGRGKDEEGRERGERGAREGQGRNTGGAYFLFLGLFFSFGDERHVIKSGR
jgi:hypothetical protein